MSAFSDIDEPSWPDILRGVQDTLAARLHTSLPGVVKSYDSATQRATVQLAVQLRGNSVPPLADVPIAWPGGDAGFVHVPLAAGDGVLVVFCEEDFSKWDATGSVSAPAVLARHGLHAVAIPGFRPTTAPLAVTGGHVTVAATAELRLGSDGASAPVALAPGVEAAFTQLKTALDGLVTALDGLAPGTKTSWDAALLTWQPDAGATKVKAV